MNLKELAELLDLSQTTVSRALNGYPEVREATRLRVTEAARLHGYLPSLSARGLAIGKAHTIGHVVPQSEHMMINPHFADFISGAGEIYALNGYEMLISVVPNEDELDTYRRLVASRRIDGLIVHGPLVDDPRIALLNDLSFPYVVHGRPGGDDDHFSWVDVNNKRSFARATRFLTDLGHRHIALINGLETMNFAARRLEGYLSAMKDRGISIRPEMMHSVEMIEPNGYEAAMEMLALEEAPTAFMTSSILLAMGVMRAVRECGLELGRDVSVLTHDDALSFLQNSGDVPMFTAMRSSIREAGKLAADLLMKRIDEPDLPPDQVLLEAELIVGNSTGPRLEDTQAAEKNNWPER